MNIIEKSADNTTLKIIVDSNEESLFSLLKVYLSKNDDVDIVGVYMEHHLVDKTEFFIRTKKTDALKLFKKTLIEVKKELENMKIK